MTEEQLAKRLKQLPNAAIGQLIDILSDMLLEEAAESELPNTEDIDFEA